MAADTDRDGVRVARVRLVFAVGDVVAVILAIVSLAIIVAFVAVHAFIGQKVRLDRLCNRKLHVSSQAWLDAFMVTVS